MMTVKSENTVTLNISLEAFGFTGMNKQELEAAILNSIQTQLTIVTTKGEKIELVSYDVPQIESIIIEDENGYPVESSDNKFGEI